jgi:hypothetical protein
MPAVRVAVAVAAARERTPCVGSDDAVGGQMVLLLERLDRLLHLRSEAAVELAVVEAERLQLLLGLEDVLAVRAFRDLSCHSFTPCLESSGRSPLPEPRRSILGTSVEEQSRPGNGWAPLSVAALAPMLSARRWLHRVDPFPHFLAHDVFSAPVYGALEQEFMRNLHPEGADSSASHFARTIRGYDATALHFHPRLTGPLRVFASRGFRDLLSAAVGVEVTRHVSGGLHHHAPGSAPGLIHTDLNPAWFVEYESADGMIVVDHKAVRYVTGEIRRPGVQPRGFIRAIAVLYYLANPPWRPGEGGETGLYDSSDAALDRPVATVPPINNSMIVFEVTPQSYHAFLTNRRSPRNCVAMWLHRPRPDVIRQWGEGVIENEDGQRVPGKARQ